jgi:hypothetical protein
MVCDPSFIAMPVLAVAAAAIGGSRAARIRDGWIEPCVVWGAVVAESGMSKSPPFRLAMQPLRERQGRDLKRYAQLQAEHDRQKLLYEKELTAWKRAKGGEEVPEPPEEPTAARCLVSDATVESLAVILNENPRGLLLARDELSGWLGSFDRYAGGSRAGADAAFWLSAFNGESVVVDRKSTKQKIIHVPSAMVSVCGTIQPGVFNRALGTAHRESGLAARLLLSSPPRRAKRWTDEGVAGDRIAEYSAVIDRLLDLPMNWSADGDPQPSLVGMDAAAKRLWVAFYNAHNEAQEELSGELSAAWSKLEGYCPRLALVLHTLRWAIDDHTLADRDTIDAASMGAAITLTRWFCNEALRTYAVLGEDDQQREERELVEWIGRHGGSCTPRDLQRNLRRFSGGGAEEALEAIVKAGSGRWNPPETTEKGGRPSRVLRLLGSADTDKTPLNSEEN